MIFYGFGRVSESEDFQFKLIDWAYVAYAVYLLLVSFESPFPKQQLCKNDTELFLDVLGTWAQKLKG